MATWIVHLRVAEKVIRQLDNINETAFYVGAIAPDSGRMVDDFTYLPPKDVSHWKREGVSYEQRFEDNAEFYKKYAENESDNSSFSFYLGYYVHILTDTMYVRDIIHPFINKNGKPYWRANITGIRKGWYEIDYRFLADNKNYRPFELLKTVKPFETKFLDYFEPTDIYERIKYAVDLYSNASTDPDCLFFTHNESDAERMIGYMSETIIKILKEKHKL